MCVGVLPVAVAPLWQLEQAPTTWAWSTREAGVQAVVTWHDSQVFDVLMCVSVLPVAAVPLWQEAQLSTMPL